MTEFYVILDDIKYKSETVLKAFDITFKTIHALNARYPPEGEHVWLLIQRLVYGIQTKYDRKIPHVETITNDLKNESIT